MKLETMEQKLLRTISCSILQEARKSFNQFDEATERKDLCSMNYESGKHRAFLDALEIVEKEFAKYEEEKGDQS